MRKAFIPIREAQGYYTFFVDPGVKSHLAAAKLSGRPLRLRYQRLRPNYSKYWQADSDAVASLCPAEVAAWFESRGDRVRTCFWASMVYLLIERRN